MKKSRPTDLQVHLIEKQVFSNWSSDHLMNKEIARRWKHRFATLRQYKVWEEFIKTGTSTSRLVDCSLSNPLRIKRTATAVYVRNLNPGRSGQRHQP